MRGHEYARAQVRAHLQATVPARLAAIKTALTATTPPNPASYSLADRLPVDPNLYPAILVTSTAAPTIRKQSVYAAGDTADFIVTYDVRVVVACRTDVAGGDEAASVDRDRLLLAVRESLLGRANLPADMEISTADLSEDTGAATQDLRGRPLSAGQITLRVALMETLTPTPAPDALEESAVDVTGYGRDTDDITPN
jgi:hypothetical protein